MHYHNDDGLAPSKTAKQMDGCGVYNVNIATKHHKSYKDAITWWSTNARQSSLKLILFTLR